MIKTLTLDGLTSVTIKQSAYDMARFCWVNNRSDSDVYISCTDAQCTENSDGVKRIPAGEHGMLDTESYETLYIKGSGMVNIETSPFAVCPFGEGKKGGGTSLSGSASYTISNAVDYPLLGLSLYGKSTQDGEPTSDTPVDIVSVGDSGSVTITVDNGDSISATAAITSALPLCGIPVDSDGNYTDSNGQQWVCDTLVYNADGTWKIIKRIGKVVFDGSDDEGWKKSDSTLRFYGNVITDIYKIKNDTEPSIVICNRYVSRSDRETYVKRLTGIAVSGSTLLIYDEERITWTIDEWKSWLAENPVIAIYKLAEPQEIALTAAEITALRQLQTFEGATNISNDAGAEMSVEYCTNKMLPECVLPITMGLQKQIDELRAAILSMGGNV